MRTDCVFNDYCNEISIGEVMDRPNAGQNQSKASLFDLGHALCIIPVEGFRYILNILIT